MYGVARPFSRQKTIYALNGQLEIKAAMLKYGTREVEQRDLCPTSCVGMVSVRTLAGEKLYAKYTQSLKPSRY